MAENNDIEKQEAERKMLFDDAMTKMMAINEGCNKRAIAKAKADEEERIRAEEKKKSDPSTSRIIFNIFLVFGGFFATIFYIIPHSIDSYGYIKTILGGAAITFIGGLIFAIFGPPEFQAEMAFGLKNPHMKCPHCNTSGNIRTKSITQKKGVSGGKAVAGLLTGGVSLLAVGLSRKEDSTQAHCQKCNNTWRF